jgi:hypothetical protein
VIFRNRVRLLDVSVALVACIAFACGSFKGTDSETNSTDGGVIAGDAGEGGSTAADGGAAPDALAPVDAGDGGPFCATVDATFCSDFDTPGLTDPPFGWGLASTIPPQLDKDHVQSPPFSLHSSTPAPTYMNVSKQFLPPKSISVDFWVRFDPLFASGAGLYGPLMISQGGGNSFVFLFANDKEPYFQAGQTQYSYNAGGQVLPAFGARTWHHVFVKVVVGSAPTVSASIDGTFAWTDFALADPWMAGGQVTVSLGVNPIYDVDAGTQLETWVDNVVISVE